MTDSIARTISLLLLTSALALPAQAQSDEGSTDPAIIVTESRPMTENETLDVVRRVARPVDGQLARFNDRVCPLVIGFQDQYEDLVEQRIREVAAKVGAPVGGAGCTPNLNVVIVDDGREFVAELERQYPDVLGGLSRREYAEVTAGEGAARSWTATMLTNSAGQGAGRNETNAGGGTAKTGYQGSSISFGDVNVMRVYESSNVNPSVQQSILASWVVIDTGATFEKTLTQLADYAAMRGLAMVRPSELAGSDDTILSLFEPDVHSSVPELTDFDLAYLTSLYSAPARRWARSQVRYIAEAIAEDQAEQATP